MAYVRKTRDEWEIQQKTSMGWESVAAADTWKQAKQTAREYRENMPEFPVRIKLVRVPKEDA